MTVSRRVLLRTMLQAIGGLVLGRSLPTVQGGRGDEAGHAYGPLTVRVARAVRC